MKTFANRTPSSLREAVVVGANDVASSGSLLGICHQRIALAANQHLIRSILAIREQGGVRIATPRAAST